MGAIPELERDLGVPVVHPVPARAWEIQRRLGLKHPVTGVGRLMELLPPAAG
jgi:maleate cis-trans isomerase